MDKYRLILQSANITMYTLSYQLLYEISEYPQYLAPQCLPQISFGNSLMYAAIVKVKQRVWRYPTNITYP